MLSGRKSNRFRFAGMFALQVFFIGTFLFATQPRVANFFADHQPIRRDTFVQPRDFFEAAGLSRDVKSADTPNQIRLFVGANPEYRAGRSPSSFAVERNLSPYKFSIAAVFQIRSPPVLPVC